MPDMLPPCAGCDALQKLLSDLWLAVQAMVLHDEGDRTYIVDRKDIERVRAAMDASRDAATIWKRG